MFPKKIRDRDSTAIVAFRIFFFFFIVYINFSICLVAKEQDIKFYRLSVEDGLSQNSAFCILQDPKGFLWFGTQDGLNRYNGYNIEIYKNSHDNPDTISNNYITSMCVDQSGLLWIGTQNGGLNQFDYAKKRFIRYKNEPDNSNSLSNNYIQNIVADNYGIIWIGTEGGGLNRFDPATKKFTRFQHDPEDSCSLSNNAVNSISIDHLDQIWIGCRRGGFNRFDKNTKKFIHYQHDPGNPNSLSSNNVLCIYADRTGTVWIGTEDGGLNRFDPAKGKFAHYLPNPNSISDFYITCIYEDQNDILWIGTKRGGLNRFDRTTNQFTHYKYEANNLNSLSENYVSSIYQDRSGVFWIGTQGAGISWFNGITKGFTHYKDDPDNPDGLKGSIISSFFEDPEKIGKELWIGVWTGELNHFNRIANRFIHYKHDPADPHSLSDGGVSCIFKDSKKNFWIGTENGLNRFDPITKHFIRYKYNPSDPRGLSDNAIYCIYEDHEGVLWIGTLNGGLNSFDRGTKQFIHYTNDKTNPHSISDNWVLSIYEDHTKKLWIGTGNGLNRFDRSTRQFIRYQNDPNDLKSLSNNHVRCIYEDQQGIIWIGTGGGGLNKFNREQNNFSYYRERDGLSNNMVYGILEDNEGNLWISTNKGMSKFNLRTEKFRNYDTFDGLQSNEFNGGACLKSETGELFFGGVNGFNSFYPERIRDNPVKPQIVFTDFKIFNKTVSVGKMPDGRTILKKSILETEEIELSYKDNVLSFEFASLHYSSPERNMYAYILEGFEKEWNYVGNRRFATYTNLSHGKYTFRVIGSNSDGIWNEEGVSLKIRIIPPYWKTWWFYTLCIFAMTVTIFSVYRMRIGQLNKRREELERLVKKRTHQLEESRIQLEVANKELEELAILDGLTGIANYRHFENFLQNEWRRATRNSKPISVILGDVDFFKLYNDTYGHQEGDECLKKIAKAMDQSVNRPGDLVARYGGEEFVIILSETDIKGVVFICEKVQAAIKDLRIVHEGSTIDEHVTISLGCASIIPTRDSDPSILIKEVDMALYQSKQKGRNQICIAGQ